MSPFDAILSVAALGIALVACAAGYKGIKRSGAALVAAKRIADSQAALWTKIQKMETSALSSAAAHAKMADALSSRLLTMETAWDAAISMCTICNRLMFTTDARTVAYDKDGGKQYTCDSCQEDNNAGV